ncbi:hypothetical protein [Amycolatopsis australiensis]|uniref:DUF4149 domain-containing protein n=1 Tax=Amycolatopsis australiensis TaxID=546364 RepID=A0A1K1REB4_9PSEU|nr:hypothetical protein [Amycolatopsis australiensis]SFW70519.1 hypothetical protein SAMN04489730_3122 [Amycolatopsis australiensis]
MTVATAITFTWLGMVLAISFLEAPLKFRAPGVTLPLGLGIGRVVFAALNRVEAGFALGLAACLVAGPRATLPVVFAAVAVVALVVQLVAVRPALTRRSDRVLAGEDGPRSHAHFVYIGLEVLKVAALLAFGIAVLATA